MMQQIYLGLGAAVDNALSLTVSSTTTNLDLATLFNTAQSGVWADSQDKTLTIDSGVIVGATSTGNAALTIPSGMGGTLTIINNGAIQGAGGAAGAAGGDAIQASSSGVTITNNGDIYAGGGGGGNGGNGGTGGNGSYAQSLGSAFNYTATHHNQSVACNNSCVSRFGGGAYCTGSCTLYVWYLPTTWQCLGCSRNTSTSGGSGGSGGAGGVGQGYNQSAGSGSSGSSGSNGGTNAGTGGTGGTGGAGGAFGNAGSTGSTGSSGGNGNVSNGSSGSAGSAGGAAGDYISGIANVTLTNNGNVAGTTS